MHPPTGKRCRQTSDSNKVIMAVRRINATGMATTANNKNDTTTTAATCAAPTTTKTIGNRCRQLSVLVCLVAIIALNNFGCLLSTTTATMQRENMRVLPLPEGLYSLLM
ncbi:uncharacterized protein LOC128857952 [Anastrepha ludens]|uniref:uncharacterized protein LOC128857952 n=1 Tax=Anastrepha ludens TaxID=28586 RepID=UPI0023B0C4C5|nr:uncharacterized protein LOC128857952 [Anastrepha ludens]